MNKRQWKKHLKKEKARRKAIEEYFGIDKICSKMLFQNLFEQISSGTTSDNCGIRIERMPMRFKARELGKGE